MARKAGSILIAFVMAVTVFFVMPENAEAKTTGATSKDFANVVIFVCFDDADVDTYLQEELTQYNSSSVLGYYDGDQGHSFKNYMDTISYGQFQVHNYFPQVSNGVISPLLIENVTSQTARTSNADSTILEYVAANAPETTDQTLDYDGDGYIDNLTVVALGAMDQNNPFSGYSLAAAHSHHMEVSTQYSGKNISNYNLIPWEQLVGNRSGVIAHEFLHTLGYSDIYNSGNDYPVGCWDIMAGTSYPQWSLAYNRMHFSHWINIETVTESKTLTLHSQKNKDGNQAFILEAPQSRDEVFVVEFRQKAERYPPGGVINDDDLDIGIGGSGLIVYRVDKSVDRLSNNYGSTGVYVFRPEGDSSRVKEAFLSTESGRTTIGSSNMSDILEDGALTYADGSNSGIVISDVSSSAGESMTCRVTMPSNEDYDLWTDTEFPEVTPEYDQFGDQKSKYSTMIEFDGKPYVMTYNGNVLQAYSYNESTGGSSWSTVGAPISNSSEIEKFECFSIEGDFYCAFSTYIANSSNYNISVYKLNNNSWTKTGTLSNVGYPDFDVQVQGGNAVFAYVSEIVFGFSDANTSKIKIAKFSNNQFDTPETVNTNKLNAVYGQAHLQFLNGTLYVSGRNTSGNVIDVYKKNGQGTSAGFSEVTDAEVAGGSYEMLSFDGKLYIAAGDRDSVVMHEYNPDSETDSGITPWKHGPRNNIANYSPTMLGSNGDIYYVASSSSSSGRITVYKYVDSSNTTDLKMKFISEGVSVDGYSVKLSMICIGQTMFISYTLNSSEEIRVKKKVESAPSITEHYHHTWNLGTPDRRATFSSEGNRIRTCSDCGKKKSVAIPAASNVRLSNTNFTYNGGVQKPYSIVKNSSDENVDSSCLTGGGRYIGTYSARVTLNDSNYENSSVDLYYKIIPKGTSIKSPKRYKKAFTARWSRQKSKMPRARITGYQIRYSTNASMAGPKYKTVKGYKKTSVKIKKLAKKRRYYVQVRTYIKTGGGTYYSYWSGVRSVVTK